MSQPSQSTPSVITHSRSTCTALDLSYLCPWLAARFFLQIAFPKHFGTAKMRTGACRYRHLCFGWKTFTAVHQNQFLWWRMRFEDPIYCFLWLEPSNQSDSCSSVSEVLYVCTVCLLRSIVWVLFFLPPIHHSAEAVDIYFPKLVGLFADTQL